MGDRPKCQAGVWTIEALHAHLEALMEASKSADDARFQMQQEALKQAAASVDLRLESMNEFRAAVEDITRRSLPRAEYDVQHQALVDRVAKAEERARELVPREEATLQHKAITDSVDRIEGRLKLVEIEQLKAQAERAGQQRTVVTLRTLVLTIIPVITVVLVLIDRLR